MKTMKTINISIDEEVYTLSKEVSKKLLGKVNFSGLVSFLINRENQKEEAEKTTDQ